MNQLRRFSTARRLFRPNDPPSTDSVLGKARYLMYEIQENGGVKKSIYKVLKFVVLLKTVIFCILRVEMLDSRIAEMMNSKLEIM